MRQGRVLFLGLLAGVLVGCATGKPMQSASWWERFRPFQGPAGADVILLDVALLERPVDDPYINQELWAAVDEQAVSLECKAVLEDSGFRVGQIGGLTPARLQKLLTSERSNLNPRQIRLHAGRATTLVLGPRAALCRFQVEQDGQPAPLALEQAQCTLNVVPTLTEDNCITLHFTPQVQHGEIKLSPRPTEDLSGFILQSERPTKSFPVFGWELTLAPNQYAIIGGRADRSETLGCQCFLRRDEAIPTQRLLVIRTARMTEGGIPDSSSEAMAEEASANQIPPLALQAAWTAVPRQGTIRNQGPGVRN
jgi:hypothetical protein